MTKVSVIIPSRTERFLPQTVAGLLNAGSDIEVIAVLDGYWPDPPLPEDNRLIQLHRGSAMGMRAGINAAAGIAKGEWLMKSDAHCIYAPGFDVAMQTDCADNCISIPRRYKVDGENWLALDPPRHLHLFSVRTLSAIARAAGAHEFRVDSSPASAEAMDAFHQPISPGTARQRLSSRPGGAPPKIPSYA